jgi:hypothetical protein
MELLVGERTILQLRVRSKQKIHWLIVRYCWGAQVAVLVGVAAMRTYPLKAW